VDLAFDPVGFAYAEALFEAVAQDGHAVYYGLMAGAEAALDLRTMILKDMAVHGYTVYRLQRQPELLREIVELLLDLAAAGRITPRVAAEYPFDRAPDALAAMAENRHLGKIILNVD
jgi:NADPH2:quinone reductase